MSQIHDLYYKFLETGDSSDLLDFIEQNPNAINDKDDEGNTVLHLAVDNKTISHVRFFLKKGADVSIRNIYNNTALHESFYCGNLRIFDAILEYGGDINERDIIGRSLLHSAVRCENITDINFLILRGADIFAIEINSNQDIIETFLETCPDNTPLLQHLFKWGIGFGYEYIGKEFKPGQLDNMVILGSTLAGKPITRATTGFEKAITNCAELEQAIKANVGINFDLLPKPATLKKFIQIKDIAEFYESYCKLYNSMIKLRGLKTLNIFAIQNQADKYTIEDIEKFPDELYKQIDIKLFKHKSN